MKNITLKNDLFKITCMFKYFLSFFFIFNYFSSLNSQLIFLSFHCLEKDGSLKLVINKSTSEPKYPEYNNAYTIRVFLTNNFIEPKFYDFEECCLKISSHEKYLLKDYIDFESSDSTEKKFNFKKKYQTLIKSPVFKSCFCGAVIATSIVTIILYYYIKILKSSNSKSTFWDALLLCYCVLTIFGSAFCILTFSPSIFRPIFSKCCFSKKPYKEKQLIDQFNSGKIEFMKNKYEKLEEQEENYNQIQETVEINHSNFFDYANETTFYKGLNKIFEPEICTIIFSFNDEFGPICVQTPKDIANLFHLGIKTLLENVDPKFKKSFLNLINKNLKDLDLVNEKYTFKEIICLK